MAALNILTGDGTKVDVDSAAVESLKAGFRGSVVVSGEEGYDKARTIWNAMIDRKPALIARCRGVSDVIRSVRFAADRGLLTAVRGGGHNIAGNAVCEGGFMIDLSLMTSVHVDPETRTAHVEPGALLSDLDIETQAFGLAVPVGINSTTGVAGLTLGGGFGWTTRKYGLTVDNLSAADVVTADGKRVRCSEKENADLFWAIRGGGGNFGIVTRFEFKLSPVGPEVLSGVIVYPAAGAKGLLQKYREFCATAPEELTVWSVLRKAPPLPFLPQEVHGTDVVVFALCYLGDPKEGEKLIAPLTSWGTPHGSHVGVQPFTAWQAAFDPLLTPGARNYWKSHNFRDLGDGALDVLIQYASKLPSGQCEIFVAQMGGAPTRKPADATAYIHRDANFVMNVHGRWDSAGEDAACTAWAREFFKAMEPHATGGVYVNFMTEEERDRVKSAYGPVYDRLLAAKRKFDPKNLFRLNQNIKP